MLWRDLAAMPPKAAKRRNPGVSIRLATSYEALPELNCLKSEGGLVPPKLYHYLTVLRAKEEHPHKQSIADLAEAQPLSNCIKSEGGRVPL